MPFDTRFEHVEVGNAQSIKLGHYMAKGRGRVAVRHRTVGAARRDTDAHAIGAPDGDRSPRDLEQEASPILDRATISVGPFVTAILQKLVRQIAVRAVNLDAVEASAQGTLGASAKLLNNPWNFFERERAGHRERHLTLFGIGRAFGRYRRRRYRRLAIGLQIGMRLAADMPELQEDPAAPGVNRIGDAVPSSDLTVRIHAGRAGIAIAADRDRRCLWARTACSYLAPVGLSDGG